MELAQKLFSRDLAREPFKAYLLAESSYSADLASELPAQLPELFETQSSAIASVLVDIQHADGPKMPILFPTRPLGPEDFSLLCRLCAVDVNELKRKLNIVRGTFYKHEPPDSRRDVSVVTIGYGIGTRPPRVAVTSLLTHPESWCAAAGGKPDLSAERFERISDLCNSILRTPRDARPAYVLFPELSIPRRWMRVVAEALLRSRISVIAGEEYSHHNSNKCVDNTARLFLTDNRLGYQSWCALRQLKGKPAHHERDELRQKFAIELKASIPELSKKAVVNHFGFRFGLLICSELTDMTFRQQFRGEIDSLFVLSWNPDLESFAALVDASALDIHCFIALVNNRTFGDSRIRAPYKESWRRDTVRVKGGLADYFVVAELDVDALRDFQSHKEPPDGPFKPYPEGFKMSPAREVIPGAKREKE